jgi:biotin synthase-like enzyme
VVNVRESSKSTLCGLNVIILCHRLLFPRRRLRLAAGMGVMHVAAQSQAPMTSVSKAGLGQAKEGAA